MAELIFQDPARQLRMERHDVAPPGFVELLLPRLLEVVLARWDLHSGLVYLDPRGDQHEGVARHGGFGLLHRLGVRPEVHVVGSATRLPPAVESGLRRRPFHLPISDDV